MKEKIIGEIFEAKERIFLIIGIGLVVAGMVFVLGQGIGQNTSEVEIIPAEEVSGGGEGEVIVDIQGAVQKPGVYRLPVGSRVNDLLVISGGLSREADREWVARNLNRAAVLQDGAKIYIPKTGERVGVVAGEKSGRLVNINQASQSELESLPGIGPSMAQRIIEYREKQGGFKSVEELMAVPGIGRKTFEKLKDKITIY